MRRAAVLLAVMLSACAANVGVSGPTFVPKDAAATCHNLCADIGLPLDSVVIIAQNVGCVCAAAPRASSAAAGGGMAAVIELERAAQQTTPAPPPHR